VICYLGFIHWELKEMLIVKKITKLKNMGVFVNYSWTSDLPEFKKYNVIYGWNGTGKTTLSKMFDALNTGSHSEFKTLEYSIYDSDGRTHSHGASFNTPVRVFNSDFIANNVDFETLSSKAINVILGDENKEAVRLLKKDESSLIDINASIAAKEKEKSAKTSAKGSEFTNIAKAISQGTQGAIVRNYNKTNAENAFKLLTKMEVLDEEQLAVLSKSVSQEPLPRQEEISLEDSTDALALINADVKEILGKTVEALVIERLKNNPDIAEWVEAGLALHNKYKNEICEFCGQPVTTIRITKIAAHFNEADAELKASIDILIERLIAIHSAIQSLKPVDKMNIYKELQSDYTTKTVVFTKERDLVLDHINNFVELVNSKKAHTTEVIVVKDEPYLMELTEAITELNKVISKHNEKTDNFEEQRKTNSTKIESHYLSTIYDTVNTLDEEIKALDNDLNVLIDGRERDDDNIGKTRLIARIRESKAKVSSSHKACEMLSTDLRTFLGHDEIAFSAIEGDSGYKILRRGKPAKSLSEGERTAIAFIFFVTQLKDEDFDVETGIIVIDDPVSSLDANSQFQAFSFLRNATNDAGQLFLFTHNFEFMKLVLYWLSRDKRKRSLYMIKNKFSSTDSSRIAYLAELDQALETYESEYHYLFNIVYNYIDDGTIENAYKMPNIARKLLDSFLMFRVPKNADTYRRLQELDFDQGKKTAIYKFVNDQSHITGSGFDPSLVPETQKCLKYLLELIEETFPEHYNYLIEATS